MTNPSFSSGVTPLTDEDSPFTDAPVPNTSHKSQDRLDQLIQHLNSTITDETDMVSLMRRHYQRLRLIKADNSWEPAFADLEGELLPTLSASNFHALLDSTGVYIRENPYLIEAINSLKDEDILSVQVKMMEDGPKIMPDVISFAMILEKLNSLFTRDISLFESYAKILRISKKDICVFKYFSLFESAKYYSIGDLSTIIDAIKTGEPRANFIRYLLPLNIFEAVCSDFCKGNFRNAYAGWRLMWNPPGGKISTTGSSPAYVDSKSQTYPILHVCPPSPKEWADSYTLWNLTFVSSYPDFPYFMTKLLIPSVSGYSQNPTSYIHNRAIALHILLNYELFRRVDDKKTTEEGGNSTELTQAPERTSFSSPQDYQSTVNQPSPPWYVNVWAKTRAFLKPSVDGKTTTEKGWNSKKLTQALGRASFFSAQNYQSRVNQLSPPWYAKVGAKTRVFLRRILGK